MVAVTCRCGYHEEQVESRVRAEVIADRHESADVRHPYRHVTRIEEARQ